MCAEKMIDSRYLACSMRTYRTIVAPRAWDLSACAFLHQWDTGQGKRAQAIKLIFGRGFQKPSAMT